MEHRPSRRMVPGFRDWAYVTCAENTVRLLSIRRGPQAGVTSASCLCGWHQTYKTRAAAIREARKHIKDLEHQETPK